MRTAVRDRLRTGAHCIKVMASGGVVSPTDPIRLPQYSEQELEAICTEAARRHSYVAAHAYSPESIVHAVRAGVRTIEHGNLLDAAAAQEMATHGAFLVPTLVAYDAMNRRGAAVGLSEDGQEKNRQVFHAGQEAITTARAAGVAIGFGTDLMGDLEDDQLLGMRLQIEADGVDNVLRSATRVNADILGREDLGRIAPGAVADMIILDADPRTDAAALWDESRPRTVIRAGTVVG
ncbi:amidohydrolase family protein [Sanguibacter sp. Z1732]|uniref:amidohydrolase family protein n=1 Tax=Sanguibacter sp. Z1732 TaxID=3435412 RepID=UPI003D9C9DB8